MNHQLLMGLMAGDGTTTRKDSNPGDSKQECKVMDLPSSPSPESKNRKSDVSSETDQDAMGLSSPFRKESAKRLLGVTTTATEKPSEVGLAADNRKPFAERESVNDLPMPDSIKRRKLQKMIARAGGYPSFRLLLTANYENSDDETPSDDELPVPVGTSAITLPPKTPHQPISQSFNQSQPTSVRRKSIYVDLDEELGLKPRKARGNAYLAGEATTISVAPTRPVLTAADEGYYEGRVDVTISPDDEIHLTDLHVWIRRQLEFFSSSAAPSDNRAASGRRSRTAPGQVGVRCKHCASLSSPPTGAVSYPQSLQGIYMACLQKPQVHFEQHCRFLPQPERDQLQVLLSSSQPSKLRGRKPTDLEGKGSVPATLYYVVSAKRLGLLEVDDGLRFGRDLTLEPLPFETMRLQVEAELSSTGALKNPLSPDPLSPVPVEPRITADDESEQVLAEAVIEPDDLSHLSRRQDKESVTDYFFLIIRQAIICHAVPMDFAGKGKKTKLIRIGFAGYCCRHCQPDPNSAPAFGSCRSFSSAADNLSSSIASSFALHLQKCPNVPVRIQKAMLAYKRLHQRQLAQLPYGSQRRAIYDLWSRLRAADISENDMTQRMQQWAPPALATKAASDAATTDEGSLGWRDNAYHSSTSGKDEALDSNLSLACDLQGRPDSFPECKDSESLSVLKEALEFWDLAENDHLIIPSDRWLISDFLFLLMRQLKVAFMNGAPSRRQSTTAGLRCMHCIDSPQIVSPSGRSFPSAPDNFASSMNNSLYSHMQACLHVPPPIKHALLHLRKLHSAQCSNLRFGSQRRFFNLLHDRLQQMQQPEAPAETGNESDKQQSVDEANDSPTPAPSIVKEVDPKAILHVPVATELSKSSFVEITQKDAKSMWVCARCRMVPLPFRVPGSCFTMENPSVDEMREHRQLCQGDAFQLRSISELLRQFLDSLALPLRVLHSESFRTLIRVCVAGVPELEQAFGRDTVRLLRDEDSEDWARTSPAGLWTKFPALVELSDVLEAFQAFADEHGASPDLLTHPHLLSFVLFISPGLKMPTE